MSDKARIQKLYEQAENAHEAGDLKSCHKLLKKVLKKNSKYIEARQLLTKLFLERDKLKNAEKIARQTVLLEPDCQVHYLDLATIYFKTEEYEKALDCCEQGLGLSSDEHSQSIYLLKASIYESMDRKEDALKSLITAVDEYSDDVPFLRSCCHKLFDFGYYDKVLKIAARLTLLGDDVFTPQISGKCLLELADAKQAEEMFLTAIKKDPGQADNYVGLSSAYAAQGRISAAQYISQRLVSNLPSGSRYSGNAKINVLVLEALYDDYFSKKDANTRPFYGSSTYAHSNAISQMPLGSFNYHHIYIDHPDAIRAIQSLGKMDIIYNNVVNAEMAIRRDLIGRLRKIIDTLNLPIINAPENVAQNTRELNYRQLSQNDGVIFPKTKSYFLKDGELRTIEDNILAEFKIPVIVRTERSHQNKDATLVQSSDDLRTVIQNLVDEYIYVIQFIHNPFQENIYRKFRCFIIDYKFCARSVYFSDYWNVHDSSFGGLRDELITLDKTYIQNPEDVLGRNNMENLVKIGETIGLDFLGIDFDLNRDGRLIIYEANPCMNIKSANYEEFYPYHRQQTQKNIEIIETMIYNRVATHGDSRSIASFL